MPTVFTAREIAESAVEKEMKRRDFYANVTKLSTDPEMIKLFEFLAAEGAVLHVPLQWGAEGSRAPSREPAQRAETQESA